jgi:large repetitive protein
MGGPRAARRILFLLVAAALGLAPVLGGVALASTGSDAGGSANGTDPAGAVSAPVDTVPGGGAGAPKTTAPVTTTPSVATTTPPTTPPAGGSTGGSSSSAGAAGGGNTNVSALTAGGTVVLAQADQDADLVVTKTDTPDPVAAGHDLTYTITVTNNGPSDAQGVGLSDILPAGTTLVSANPSQGTCNPIVLCDFGTVASGATTTLVLTVHVDSSTPDHSFITNKATALSATTDPDTTNNTATATTTVETSADLVVTKTDTPDPVTAGTNLTYTITVSNTGTIDAQTVTLTDVVPPGTTFVAAATSQGVCSGNPNITCSIGTLPAGATATITLIVHVDPATADGTVIANTAVASTTTTEPNTSNNAATATTMVAASADVAVTKVPDFAISVTAGTDLTYTITATNTGPSDAQNVTVTDPLPAGTTFDSALSTQGSCSGTTTVTCTLGTLLAGASATITLVVHVDPAAPAGSTLTNTATASSSTADPDPTNNTATATTTVATQADLGVTKIPDQISVVTAGTDLTYTITATNSGPSDAQDVAVTDTLPAATTFVSVTPSQGTCSGGPIVTCSLGTLAIGASATFTLVVHVDPIATGTIFNTATVSSTTVDPNPGNDTASAANTIVVSADVAVTKTDTPDPVPPGGFLTYTITVTNTGPSDTPFVVLMDTLPNGTTLLLATPSQGSCFAGPFVTCPIGPVADGASATITLVVFVSSAVPDGTVLTNEVSAGSPNDPNFGNNTAFATTTVEPVADVAVTKTDNPDPVTAGTDLTYTLTASNGGPSDAESVTVTDTLPAGEAFVSATPSQGSCSGTTTITCNLGTIAKSASATVTVVVHVDPSVANGATLDNTATASSTTADSNSANNSASSTTTVHTSADVSLAKADALTR